VKAKTLKWKKKKKNSQIQQAECEYDLLGEADEFEYELLEEVDKFEYTQACLDSKVQITGDRAKPIVLLANYINDDHDLAVEMHEPSDYLSSLTVPDLEDLLTDITIHKNFKQQQQQSGEKPESYDTTFWKDVTTITSYKLAKLRTSSSRLYNDQKDDDKPEKKSSGCFSSSY